MPTKQEICATVKYTPPSPTCLAHSATPSGFPCRLVCHRNVT